MRLITNRMVLISAMAVFVSGVHSDAGADIGKVGGIAKVGSPVIISNLPKPPPQDGTPPSDENSDAATDTKKEPTVLLDIVFNQNRVNFQPSLRAAIMENEASYPGMVYEVASVIPSNSSSPSQAARFRVLYDENLNAVTQQMVSLGLQPNRVRTTTVVKEEVTSQDIVITAIPQ